MNAELDAAPVRIPVAITKSHVHLTAALIEQLFCDRYRLHPHSALGQPHLYEAQERVTLVGANGRRLRDVIVIGPARSVNQIEISRTEAQLLGVPAPIRDSGDLLGTPGITLEGPRSTATLGTGVICAHRHIHMPPDIAQRLGLKDRDRVELSTDGCNRGLVFRDVRVRVSRDYELELHLDTDEGNAAGLRDGDVAFLQRRRS